MAGLSRKYVLETLGELDDAAIADIIATGATAEELAEAHAWLENDEALMNAGKHLPSGRVARLLGVIAAKEEEQEGEGRR